MMHEDRTFPPDPNCYGCLGTGRIKWAGVDPNRECPCIHDDGEGPSS